MSTETLAVRVEQARALHPTWTAERAAAEVGASVQFVRDVWALQDAAVPTDNAHDCAQPRLQHPHIIADSPGMTALAEAARLELARVYTHTIPSVEPAPAPKDAEIAYWRRQGRSPASIAFRLGLSKKTVVEALQRLGAA